jgi:hypothetical protein
MYGLMIDYIVTHAGERLLEGEGERSELRPGRVETAPDRETGGVEGGSSRHVRSPCWDVRGPATSVQARVGVRKGRDAL